MNIQPSPHPALEILSLYAAGDLPFFLRLRTATHVKECAACEQQILSLRSGESRAPP